MTVSTDWQSYLNAQRDHFIENIMQLVRIPSISALSEHAGDMSRAAKWAAECLTDAGLENVRVMPTDGHPVVYGDWLHAPGKPTVMIYGHLDVQPVDPVELWESPPFEPLLKDGRIYARGASDDKGNLLSPINAVEALLATEDKLPLNLKFLLEGEEEIGSPSLPGFLAQHGSMLACDLALSADGLQEAPDKPCIVYSTRGETGFEIQVQGPNGDQHSGLYGGIVQNPNRALAHILDSFYDEKGDVAVEGFYDDVREISAQDRDLLALTPFDADEVQTRLQVPCLVGDEAFTPAERLGARPTLEIVGMAGGFAGEGLKNIIPARSVGKVSCRLVADQDPEMIGRAIKEHVARHTLPGVTAKVIDIPGVAHPYLMPPDHPANLIAAQVLEELYGQKPVFNREGGSIAACGLFLKELGVVTVSFGFSHEDENLHAPNEFFRLESMEKGQRGYVQLLQKLGESL